LDFFGLKINHLATLGPTRAIKRNFRGRKISEFARKAAAIRSPANVGLLVATKKPLSVLDACWDGKKWTPSVSSSSSKNNLITQP
jgi:hypothetical protein